MRFPHLFSSGRIGKCHLRNRIIMPLFPTKYATESKANRRMIEFYRARARGGAALIVLDCPCLDYPRTYKGGTEIRFDEEQYVENLSELLHVIHSEGARVFMHLTYPDERIYLEEVSGSKKKGDVWLLPLTNTMSSDDANEIIEIMANGAARAREIGYDGIEIQASYGGLAAQLLSPLTNKRKDYMGGDPESRASFLTRLIEKVKETSGRDFPVMVKLVCHEFVPGGLGIKDAQAIAKLLEYLGTDAITANAGNKSTKHITIPSHDSHPGSLVEVAAQIKASVNIPVIAIGKINSPNLADDILGEGKADFIAMARALVADPDLPNKASSGMIDEIRGCIYCLEDCAEKGVSGLGRCCTVNPFAGFEYKWHVTPVLEKKKVLIIGAGPSGMQAAIIASERGHEVELWEMSDQVGGQLKLASIAPFKTEVAEALRYLKHCLYKSDVKIQLGYHPDVSEIIAFAPDVVIVATGSYPGRPSIPGIDSDFVIDARAVYEKGSINGEKVVIVGGGEIGCETADWLGSSEREIAVVEMLPQVMNKMKKIPRERLLSRLSQKAVTIYTEAEITRIGKSEVHVKRRGDEDFSIRADIVICAVGSKPENTLADKLKGRIKEVLTVGDATSPGHIGSALRSATQAALKI